MLLEISAPRHTRILAQDAFGNDNIFCLVICLHAADVIVRSLRYSVTASATHFGKVLNSESSTRLLNDSVCVCVHLLRANKYTL